MDRMPDLLRANPKFFRVWLSEIVSGFGDWFNLVATATLISILTGSSNALGVLFVLRLLSPFLIAPFGGVLADRYSQILIMLLSDISRGLVVLCFLLVREPGDVWLLYLLTFLQLGLSGLFVPARAAILPDIVEPQHLGAANALSSTTYAIMQVVGAAAAGFLAGSIGLYETFVVDAFTYFISALFILRITSNKTQLQESVSSSVSFFRMYFDGLTYLAKNVETFMLSIQKGMNSFFVTGALNVITMILALRYFPIGLNGSYTAGLLFCMTGIGTAIGPVIARRFISDNPAALRKGLLYSYLLSAVGLLCIAPLSSLLAVSIGMLIRGMGGGMMFVLSTHLLHIRLPKNLRGRIFSNEYAIRTLLGAIGTAIFSFFVDSVVGFAVMIWISVLAALIPAIVWGWWLIYSRSSIET